jgi:hypothetical protein
MNNLQKIANEIKAQNDRKALGYESTLDFNFGYLSALRKHGVITNKEYNALKKVFLSRGDYECRYIIEDGKLVDLGKSDF